MSCDSKASKDECGPAGGYFEDQPVKCPVNVPDTYMFKCPGDMCDSNNNKPAKEECPPIRQMPKTDCSKCVNEKPPAEKCPPPKEPEKKKECIEDNPPPMKGNLPDTKGFKCPGEGCCGGPSDSNKPKDDCKPEPKKTECRECGAPVAGKRCNCSTKPPPNPPKPPPCDCRGSTCGPNTECIVTPLTMKQKR